MKKRKIALLMASVMAIGALTGCGSGQKTEEKQPVAEKAEIGEDGKRDISGELNLAIFQGGYGPDYWEELITRFEEEYPEVTVKYEISPKIGEIVRPKIISGDAPDLLVHSQGANDGVVLGLIKDEQLTDLTDLYEEVALDKDEKLKDTILNGVLESTACSPYGDGKTYLAPLTISPSGWVYNKTLFEEKGWKVPTTWDEFFELGDVAKKEGRALLTYPGLYPGYFESTLFAPIASAAGVDALKDIFNYKEGSFSTPEVMSVLENTQKIVDGDYLLKGTTGMNHTQSQTEMMLGHALFIPNGVWIENEMKDAPREGDDKFQFAMTSSLKLTEEDDTYICATPDQMSIPKGAKNPEAAKEFIKFIYKDENVKLYGEKAQAAIAVKGVTELIKEYISPSSYGMLSIMDSPEVIVYSDTYTAVPAGSKYDPMAEILEKGLTPVMNGDMTAEEWSKHVEQGFTAVNKEIAEANK